MDKNNWDNFFIGFLGCSVLTISLYFLMTEFLRPLAENFNKGFIFFYPKAELYILVTDVILFRVFMINLQIQNFGKGWLFSLFIFAMYFFYDYYKNWNWKLCRRSELPELTKYHNDLIIQFIKLPHYHNYLMPIFQFPISNYVQTR